MARKKKVEEKKAPVLDVQALFEAAKDIETEYRIDKDTLKDILASSFQAAYKKDHDGESLRIAIVMN